MSTSTGSRTGLSRERVVAAAVELADEHGTAGLSMRKLAQHLGFEAMSLYNHVANKSDLVEAMIERVAGEIDQPPDDAEWRAGIRELAVSTRAALLRHPWALDVWNQHFPGPTRFGLMERLLALIAAGGFTGYLGDLAFHAVNLHVNGFTQQQLGYRMDAETSAAMLVRFETEVPADDYPLLVAHKEYHDEVDTGRREHPDEFVFVLDLILDGLARARDADGSDPSDRPD